MCIARRTASAKHKKGKTHFIAVAENGTLTTSRVVYFGGGGREGGGKNQEGEEGRRGALPYPQEGTILPCPLVRRGGKVHSIQGGDIFTE